MDFSESFINNRSEKDKAKFEGEDHKCDIFSSLIAYPSYYTRWSD